LAVANELAIARKLPLTKLVLKVAFRRKCIPRSGTLH
jgi:hypothetical protein